MRRIGLLDAKCFSEVNVTEVFTYKDEWLWCTHDATYYCKIRAKTAFTKIYLWPCSAPYSKLEAHGEWTSCGGSSSIICSAFRCVSATTNARKGWVIRGCPFRAAGSRCEKLVVYSTIRRDQKTLFCGGCRHQERLLATNLSKLSHGQKVIQPLPGSGLERRTCTHECVKSGFSKTAI